MEEINFKTKETLAEYFDTKYSIIDRRFQDSETETVFVFPMGDINKELYERLVVNNKWKEVYEPLDFFKLLYNQLDLILTEEDGKFFPGCVMDKLNKLDLTQVQYGYLLYSLTYITGQLIIPLDFREYTLERNPRRRPLQDIHYQILWKYFKIRDIIGSNILPENFDRIINLLQSRQIALIYIYNGQLITRDNGPEIAAKYNRCKKTSGDELYCDFQNLSKKINRTGDPGSLRKLDNGIKLIESIKEYLSDKGKKQADEDLKLLNIHRIKY
jgi:hypothetical protein